MNVLLDVTPATYFPPSSLFAAKIQRFEKVFAPFPISFAPFWYICHTYMFHIIKLIVILEKNNQSKYKTNTPTLPGRTWKVIAP